ncbi:4'-phosphopantetheinyl transferase superfamily protein [Paenibacillus sp. ACRSA]|uniref:4'-phosphopantetheinyl transferase family protein n=1 Tax=Paenibacillus sp. ACRSA TaxID=2918211 RepID=UPI001EF747EA|nr:4'-phosphopantetheinyl transferase superfamily protein [Paenibacillus sp. ACRSA]MCG7378207.1 4'-phosphopantetheinyl transferase superfamily protein [Paenibacillus sp. ACRSA]
MLKLQVMQVPSILLEDEWELLLSMVSAERRAGAARYVHQADAYRSVLGEALARVTLADQIGGQVRDISFSQNEYGKPFLRDHADLPFNLSHSGDWVVMISGGHDLVGIDVEQIKPIDLQIADRFFAPQENRYLISQPADVQLETFYRLWTLKESYIKAVGKGLSIPLDSFAILPNDQGDWHCEQDEAYRFHSERLDDGHMLAACSVGLALPTTYDVVTVHDLIQAIRK